MTAPSSVYERAIWYDALLENGIEDEKVSAVDAPMFNIAVSNFKPQFLSVIKTDNYCQVSWKHFGAEGLPSDSLDSHECLHE